MKKFLLSMAAAFAGFTVMATPITVDFTSAEGLPTDDASTTVQTATFNDVDFSFFHCKYGKYSSFTYLQISGKTYTGDDAAYMEFKLPEDLTAFTLHSGGNGSVKVQVSLTVNGKVVGDYSAVTLDQKDADFSFVIPADLQAAGTVYRLTTVNKYNAQINGIVFNPEGTVTPDPDPTPDPEPTPDPDPTPVDPAKVVELDVTDAVEIQGGDDIPEVPASGNSNGTGRHIQPLESLEIDGYLFTFSQGSNEKNGPAYYWPMTNKKDGTPNTDGKRSIRLYAGNSMTVTAPGSEKFTSLVSIPDNSSTETVLYNGVAVNSLTYTATGSVRINILKVGSGEGGDTPIISSDVVFENDFQNNLDGFTVKNVIDNAYDGWKMNNNPKCAIANSYVSGENVEAESWLISKELDLSGRTECTLSFEQGFGWTFPEAPSEFYTLMIRETANAADAWDELEITEYPAKPASGNWTKDWAVNTFDLSKYEGKKIEVAFVYKNDGVSSRAWELKNFSVKGKSSSAVAEIESEAGVAEYYTLQGVKVANPENGLYICVKNGKATKILVK